MASATIRIPCPLLLAGSRPNSRYGSNAARIAHSGSTSNSSLPLRKERVRHSHGDCGVTAPAIRRRWSMVECGRVHFSTIAHVWHEVFGTQPSPPKAVVLGATIAAVAAVLVRNVWAVLRNTVTVAHEGGHALVALLVGRRLTGIRLHSDTSGLTVSHGRPSGPGVVATLLAGYLVPSLLGLGYAALLASDHITALLWLSVILLVAMLVLVRNVYGVFSILVTAGAIFAVSWFASTQVQAAFAYFFTFFLVAGAVRSIWELQQSRYQGRASDSDADQLARLTRVPGLAWVALFGVITLGIMTLTGIWLIPTN